jgi:hypothetical protein
VTTSACSRGGRSPNWNQESMAKAQPRPGSGQTGPGMARQVNNVNGPDNTAFAYSEQPSDKSNSEDPHKLSR